MIFEKEGLCNSIDFTEADILLLCCINCCSFCWINTHLNKYKNGENVSYDLCEMPTDYSLLKIKSTLLCVIKQKFQMLLLAYFHHSSCWTWHYAPCYTFFLHKVCLQYQNVRFFSPISLSLNILMSPIMLLKSICILGAFCKSMNEIMCNSKVSGWVQN